MSSAVATAPQPVITLSRSMELAERLEHGARALALFAAGMWLPSLPAAVRHAVAVDQLRARGPVG